MFFFQSKCKIIQRGYILSYIISRSRILKITTVKLLKLITSKFGSSYMTLDSLFKIKSWVKTCI